MILDSVDHLVAQSGRYGIWVHIYSCYLHLDLECFKQTRILKGHAEVEEYRCDDGACIQVEWTVAMTASLYLRGLESSSASLAAT